MSKKKKVLLLHNIISPYRNPLFEELSKKYDLTVYFCKENDLDRKWSTKLDGYTFKYKILAHKQIGPFVINPKIKKELKETEFDIYILFENPENTFTIKKIINYAKKNKKKLICVNGRKDDDIYTLKNLNESKNIIKNYIYKIIKYSYKKYREKIYLNFNSFVSYCNSSTKYLISKNINSNIIFTGIQNMPESLLLKSKWKEKPKEFKNKKVIFYLGYLNERKGVNYLIDAFNKLNKNDILLVLIGSGNDENELKILAKNNKNIIFLGYLDGVDRANYYSIADIFIMPSLYDVWGHVITEALYYGVPVICTENTGAKELIEDGKTGFIVPIKDSDAIANKINTLLENPKLLEDMKRNVAKIPKSKIVDIKTTVNTFEKAIEE